MRKRHESTLGVSIHRFCPIPLVAVSALIDWYLFFVALQMDVKFLTNQRFARKNNLSRAEADQRYKDRIAAQAGKKKPVSLQE